AGVPLSSTAVARTQTAGSAWWIDDASGVYLLRLDAGAIRVRTPAGLATLMGPPPSTSAGAAFADAEGTTDTLTPRAGELLWQPAASNAAAVGEIVTVASTSAAGMSATAVVLQAALANAYDPATVTVRGNVVPATQGATQGGWPRPEVLGSGNASVSGQRFKLARSPLTFVPADTPTGSKSTLKVWVNGVEWTEVDTLYGQPPDTACYQVRVDESGAATVVFGDGVYGARLPTGVGNVTAQYRVGIGPGGNVGAGRVTVLRNAPLGARGVTNPVAADGGAVGQTAVEAKLSAPLRSRTLQRVVALEDFRDFTLAYPGISKAGVRVVRDLHGRQVVVVTVAGGRGAPEQPDQGLLDDLQRAMAGAGARGAFRVLAYDEAAFRAWARITVDPRREPQAVLAAARERLKTEYAFAVRALGEGAAASHAVAVLQGVPGVEAVALDAFHRSGASRSVQAFLPALAARVDPRSGHLLPAQLLLPDATEGIVVRLAEVAP
ncbi:MAG TPA: hypothetical protein VFQ39_07805, partial [Longimicrobium sp.]|nr:hypothetical protein [Longimicrobium sp.]